MNRGLVMTLCAAALAAGSLAHAQAPTVNISLNLRYTNPAAPAQGGTWTLVAKTNSNLGIAAVNAYISNIASAGVAYGTTAVNGYTAVTGAQIGAELNNASQPFVVAGAPVNVVYFQDTANGPVIGGVGTATFPQRQAADVLKNVTTWNNATVIATGTFAGGGNAGNLFNRPDFIPKGGNSTDANTLASLATPSNNAIDATTTVTVRGDSLNTLNLEAAGPTEGLRVGDRNRDFIVNLSGDIFPALAAIGAGAGKTWDQGDFNGNGSVNLSGDIFPALASIGQPGLPPAIGAVPEPGAAVLGVIALLGLTMRNRKN